jgi:hypothetical protein
MAIIRDEDVVMSKSIVEYKDHLLDRLQLELPKHLTISAGQAISGLQMMEYERLAQFVDSNPKHFVYYPTMDAAVYTGPDTIIP